MRMGMATLRVKRMLARRESKEGTLAMGGGRGGVGTLREDGEEKRVHYLGGCSILLAWGWGVGGTYRDP